MTECTIMVSSHKQSDNDLRVKQTLLLPLLCKELQTCNTPRSLSVALRAASRRAHMTLASSLLMVLSSSASVSTASRTALCLSTCTA